MSHEFRGFLCAVKDRNFRFASLLLKIMAYGLTHRRCRECRAVKGLTLHPFCERCQFRNIEAGLICDSCGCSPFRDCDGCGCECHVAEEMIL